MSLEARYLDHEFDEESNGFGEPQAPQATPVLPVFHEAGRVLVGFGLLSTAWFGLRPHIGLPGFGIHDQWAAFAAVYGALFLGVLSMIIGRYHGTTPGIKHDGLMFGALTHRGISGWFLAAGLSGAYVLLYFADWTQRQLGLEALPLAGLTDAANPMARLLGLGDQQNGWFLYSMLYTLSVAVYAIRMVYRYRHSRYHLIRTASVTFFQLGIAFLLPTFLQAANEPAHFFSYFWPLDYDAIFPTALSDLSKQGALGTFIIVWSFVAAFIAVPILTYRFGKRWYCSWVCGCGGLAETAGDAFRHLSDKSTKAWKFERVSIHTVLIAIIALTISMWVFPGTFSDDFRFGYYFVIVQMFAGVIGTGFYPLLGNRAWCRFGCPQAAILGLLQRYFSRFRITTNGGQCMSCGNCSTYCEMGIDVRAYAQKGENIIRASCVGCGVCSAVCPRGVLRLENGATSKDRYDGAATPLDQFFQDVKSPPRP